MTEKVMFNLTGRYVIDQLHDLITEIEGSRSALLASGFLDFDGNRIDAVCNLVKEVTKLRPVDLPEVYRSPINTNGGE